MRAASLGLSVLVACSEVACFDFPLKLGGGGPRKPLGQVSELSYSVPLAVGTWQAGNRLLYDYSSERDEALLAAWSLARSKGVRFFDTGDSYGTGELEGNAEVLLGRFASTAAEEAWIHTKLAVYPWRLRPDDFVRACEASLRRIRSRKVALVGQHWSAETYGLGWLQDPAVYEGLSRCVALGLASGVGLSNLGPVGLSRGVDRVNQGSKRVRNSQL